MTAIDYQVTDRVARLTLNRPERFNPLSYEMISTIQAELDAIASDPSIRVVILAAEGKGFKAVTINHISYQVKDYAKTRDFYVGLFGMKVSEDDGKQCRLSFGDNILIPRNRTPTPLVDHIAYTIADWDKEKEAIGDELKRRGLQPTGDVKTSFSIKDPDGFHVQIGGKNQ